MKVGEKLSDARGIMLPVEENVADRVGLWEGLPHGDEDLVPVLLSVEVRLQVSEFGERVVVKECVREAEGLAVGERDGVTVGIVGVCGTLGVPEPVSDANRVAVSVEVVVRFTVAEGVMLGLGLVWVGEEVRREPVAVMLTEGPVGVSEVPVWLTVGTVGVRVDDGVPDGDPDGVALFSPLLLGVSDGWLPLQEWVAVVDTERVGV